MYGMLIKVKNRIVEKICQYLYSVKAHDNSLTLIAICSSVLLLLVLELFWLRMEFKDELSRFHRETHMIFRNTVLELNDSLVQKNIVAIAGAEHHPQSAMDTGRLKRGEKVVRIWLDSLRGQVNTNSENRPLIDTTAKRGMLFRFRLDSFDRDVIHKKYTAELSSAGLELPVDLVYIDSQPFGPGGQIFMNDDIVQTPSGSFKLAFSDMNFLILKNIAPQIIFSIILSLVVIGSFILVYRNLLLQQRLVVMKDGLISNISHELKTPITTVGVALEGLKNFKGQFDPVAASEYLTIAENELKRLSLLTDKVLKTSIDNTANTSAHFQLFNAKDLISEVVQSFRLISEKNRVFVELDIKDGEYSISGDREDISTLLFNLLDNALKYSGQNAQIAVQLQDLQENISIAVKDNGVGIPKAYQSKIFEKFFRVPTGDVHTVKGYGLGLSYVQQVVKRHEGEIVVESEPNSGSKFTVNLPKTHAKK